MIAPHAPGATYLGEGRCRFRVWAPAASKVEVHLLSPADRVVPLAHATYGHYEGILDGTPPGSRYKLRVDGSRELPDPASRFQPDGVHGPSAVVDPQFNWGDAVWTGRDLRDLLIYEIHVGTFTNEGTFEAMIPHLDDLRETGVGAIELMPVAQFPGRRNWGYDGAYPFAPQNSYGGSSGLKRLVDACHRRGLAVLLDVVYNHFGPEGSYAPEFGPYLTNRHRTPWGPAMNFDGDGSAAVRAFFIENALHWVTEYHIDGFRLDAIHAIFDQSPVHFLEELTSAVHRRGADLGRRVLVIAESALNDPRVIRATPEGGYGLDGQWSNDFHHALHVSITGERSGYYADFAGVEDLSRAYRDGFVYTGQFSSFRGRPHGSRASGLPGERFVVSAQDHDQVGNRMRGERLLSLTSAEGLRVAAAAVLLSPFTPVLFMGEEYGEAAPFCFFTDHSDPILVEAVRKGRRRDYGEAFGWGEEPPDPQDDGTFQGSKLDRARCATGEGRAMKAFYRELIGLRRSRRALRATRERLETRVFERERVLQIRRWDGDDEVVLVLGFAGSKANVELALPEGDWVKMMDSFDERWLGPGSSAPSRLRSPVDTSVELGTHQAILYAREAAA